jgi:hypothetical protein
MEDGIDGAAAAGGIPAGDDIDGETVERTHPPSIAACIGAIASRRRVLVEHTPRHSFAGGIGEKSRPVIRNGF